MFERTLNLLLLSRGISGTTGGGSTTGSGGGSSATRANVDEQVLDVLALQSLFCYIVSQMVLLCRNVRAHAFGDLCAARGGLFRKSYLGEDGSPDGLDLSEASSLDQGLELVGLF